MTRSCCALLTLAGCLPTLPTLDDPCGAFPQAGLYRLPLDDAEGKQRVNLVYVPRGTGPRDLVFMLHGAGQNPDIMQSVTGWNEQAERQGFAVVYPPGTGGMDKVWNAGDNPYTDADDVAYLDRVAETATERLCGARILAVGFSNGASMAHTWGCQSPWPDAIVPTEGAYLADRCPEIPKPIRAYHGTADTTVPIEGAVREGVAIPGLDETMALKAEQNACEDLPPTVTTAGAETCETWQGCAASTVACTLSGWGHRYPGGDNRVGLPFDATADSWAWFDAVVPR